MAAWLAAYGCLAMPGWLAVYVALPPADLVVGHSYVGSQEVDCGSIPYVANC